MTIGAVDLKRAEIERAYAFTITIKTIIFWVILKNIWYAGLIWYLKFFGCHFLHFLIKNTPLWTKFKTMKCWCRIYFSKNTYIQSKWTSVEKKVRFKQFLRISEQNIFNLMNKLFWVYIRWLKNCFQGFYRTNCILSRKIHINLKLLAHVNNHFSTVKDCKNDIHFGYPNLKIWSSDNYCRISITFF